jgi:integral membrane protein
VALSGILLRYRIMAYIVGVMLIVVFCAIPFQAVEQVVGPIHGVLYILYLAAALHLVVRARLGLWTLIAMVTAGWIPFVAFVVERWVTRRVTATATTP